MSDSMKEIYLTVAGTTSSKKYHIPFKDECRLIAAYVTNTTAQGDAAAVVNLNIAGGATLMTADLQNADALAGTVAQWGGAVTENAKRQVFDLDNPLEIDVNLQASSQLGIILVVDPYVIGSKKL